MEIDLDLNCVAGPSGIQKRQQPETDKSADPSGSLKKTKVHEDYDEHMGDLSHLVHAELDFLKTIVDSDSLAKRITISMRKELTGSYSHICSVVRDITYRHAKLEGAYVEMLKNKDMVRSATQDGPQISIPEENKGSYARALKARREKNSGDHISVHDVAPDREPPKKQKGKGQQPSEKTPALAPKKVQSSNQAKAVTEGTFQLVKRKNKSKRKPKKIVDLTLTKKAPTLTKFVLKDSATTEDYPGL